MAANCHWCVNVCVNGWMRGINCTALWIKALYKCCPFTNVQLLLQHLCKGELISCLAVAFECLMHQGQNREHIKIYSSFSTLPLCTLGEALWSFQVLYYTSQKTFDTQSPSRYRFQCDYSGKFILHYKWQLAGVAVQYCGTIIDVPPINWMWWRNSRSSAPGLPNVHHLTEKTSIGI